MATLNREQFGEGPNLTFIHGWGAQNSIWKAWIIEYFAEDYSVHLIELPGCGDSPALPNSDQIQQAWLDALQAVLPESTHLVGWSLGGLLSQQLAAQNPQQILTLTNLASTPRFIQTDGWKWAMNPELMNDFIQALSRDTLATLQHFWKLQIQGSDGARQLIKHFISQMKARKMPHPRSLAQGLQLLKEIDNRDLLQKLETPVLWLLGENDPLIPQEFVSEFSTIQPNAEVSLIQGAAHMPFYSHPQETAQALSAFIIKNSPLTTAQKRHYV